MHHSYQSITPVANKYLAHQNFVKAQKEHEHNIKHAHGLLDQSAPVIRPHCSERLKQKQIKEEREARIKYENERIRTNAARNGAFVDTHNDYVVHSLNTEKRVRDQAQHENEFQRLQKHMSQVRTSYPTGKFQHDFEKQQDVKKRICRHPSTDQK